jgi:outer membrane protein TolC
LRNSRSYDLTYGLTLSFDVFDGLNRRRRLENAAVRQRTAELAVEDVRTQLTADLTSAFTNYRNRLELVALERENLDATSANVDIALERFELGEITSVELREVQEQLIQAESRLLAAQFEAKQAEVTLLQLSGQLRDRLPGAQP